MRNLKLDIDRFEYHDNVAVDCCQNMQEKIMVVYFDYYYYITKEPSLRYIFAPMLIFFLKGGKQF